MMRKTCENSLCSIEFETSKAAKRFCSRRCKRLQGQRRWNNAHRESLKLATKRWFRSPAGKAYRREWAYAMSTDDFEKRLSEQANKCALCHEDFSERDGLCIDHDHACCPTTPTCGKCTRGLIHSSCNRFLGSVKDSLGKIRLAAAYLEKHARRS
jgi:Recombination endonuclease VII